jgi:DNA-binding transcriptional LysR family regulator
MKRSDLNLLYALDAFAKTGSVKAAAEMLNLSAPAMSHALARLREATGDPLLVRAGRKLVPTPRATTMIEEAREVVERARAILAPAIEDERWSLTRREFAVIAPDELSATYGARLLGAIKAKMPNATLSLLPAVGAESDRLRQGTIDVEIRGIGKLPPEMRVEVLRKQQAAVVVHRSHELARQKMTLTRYIKADHVCLAPHDELDRLVERALEDAALAAVSQSALIATVQDSIVRAVAKNLGLVSLPFPLGLEQLSVGQIWHPRVDLDPQHIWLRTCIQSVLGRG